MRLPTTELGSTGLTITPVGFGAWAIGGAGWPGAWGPQDDRTSIDAIHRALELGVNWIDTAAAYGFGHSETVIGRAIEGMGERPYVFTKCSLLEEDGAIAHSLDRDSIRREAEASLTRLGVDAIDLYQIHDAKPVEDLEVGWAAMRELKDEGLVRHIGVSNFTLDQLRRIQSIAPVETLQPAYSLIHDESESELLPAAELEGIGVVVYSPMGSGLLTGRMTPERVASLPEDDWRKRHVHFQGAGLERNLALADRVRSVASRLGVAPGAVAVAWALRHPAVDGAIVGFRRPDQVEDLIPAATLELGDDEVAELVAGRR